MAGFELLQPEDVHIKYHSIGVRSVGKKDGSAAAGKTKTAEVKFKALGRLANGKYQHIFFTVHFYFNCLLADRMFHLELQAAENQINIPTVFVKDKDGNVDIFDCSKSC